MARLIVLMIVFVFALEVGAVGQTEKPFTNSQGHTVVPVPGEFVITIKLREKLDGPAKEKVLLNSSIHAIQAKPFSLVSGGQSVDMAFDDEVLVYGEKITGKIGDPEDGSVPVAVQFSIGKYSAAL